MYNDSKMAQVNNPPAETDPAIGTRVVSLLVMGLGACDAVYLDPIRGVSFFIAGSTMLFYHSIDYLPERIRERAADITLSGAFSSGLLFLFSTAYKGWTINYNNIPPSNSPSR